MANVDPSWRPMRSNVFDPDSQAYIKALHAKNKMVIWDTSEKKIVNVIKKSGIDSLPGRIVEWFKGAIPGGTRISGEKAAKKAFEGFRNEEEAKFSKLKVKAIELFSADLKDHNGYGLRNHITDCRICIANLQLHNAEKNFLNTGLWKEPGEDVKMDKNIQLQIERLKEKISEVEEKIPETYFRGSIEAFSFEEQIENLDRMNTVFKDMYDDYGNDNAPKKVPDLKDQTPEKVPDLKDQTPEAFKKTGDKYLKNLLEGLKDSKNTGQITVTICERTIELLKLHKDNYKILDAQVTDHAGEIAKLEEKIKELKQPPEIKEPKLLNKDENLLPKIENNMGEMGQNEEKIKEPEKEPEINESERLTTSNEIIVPKDIPEVATGGAAIEEGDAPEVATGGAAIEEGDAPEVATGGAAIEEGDAPEVATGGAAIEEGDAPEVVTEKDAGEVKVIPDKKVLLENKIETNKNRILKCNEEIGALEAGAIKASLKLPKELSSTLFNNNTFDFSGIESAVKTLEGKNLILSSDASIATWLQEEPFTLQKLASLTLLLVKNDDLTQEVLRLLSDPSILNLTSKEVEQLNVEKLRDKVEAKIKEKIEDLEFGQKKTEESILSLLPSFLKPEVLSKINLKDSNLDSPKLGKGIENLKNNFVDDSKKAEKLRSEATVLLNVWGFLQSKEFKEALLHSDLKSCSKIGESITEKEREKAKLQTTIRIDQTELDKLNKKKARESIKIAPSDQDV
jgi:hypothetical protein